MSDLYAQFSLGLTPVFPVTYGTISSQYQGATGTYSRATINSIDYWLVNYALSQPGSGPVNIPGQYSGADTYTSTYSGGSSSTVYDQSHAIYISPQIVSAPTYNQTGGTYFSNYIDYAYSQIDGKPDLGYGLSLTYTGLSKLVTPGETVANVLGSISGPAITLTAPNLTMDYPYSTGNVHFAAAGKVIVPSYIWVKLVSSTDLFNNDVNIVNFNSLLYSQKQAIDGGADQYNGMGGNDIVTLPNAVTGVGTSSAFDASKTFSTGSKQGDTYTVHGGTGGYKIALGEGTDNIDLSGSGASIVTGGTGQGNIKITGSGSTILNVGSGITSLTLSGSGKCTIDFFAPNQTVVIIGGNENTHNIFVNGFQAGDHLVFQDQANLTSCAQFYPSLDPDHVPTLSGEVDVYSGEKQFANVVFDNQELAKSIQPVKYSGGITGTDLTIDTSKAPAGNPSGTLIDWGFVHEREGNSHLEAYVPEKGRSGVTIATGVDLGQGLIGQADLQALDGGQQNNNISALYPAARSGVTWKGTDSNNALNYLGAYYEYGKTNFSAVSQSISITTAQAQTLTYNAEIKTLSNLKTFLDGKHINFSDLPSAAQTVIFDIAYRLNVNGLPTNSSTSKFWVDFQTAATSNSAAAWAVVYNDLLHNFNQIDPIRNSLEAKLLLKIDGVSELANQSADNGGPSQSVIAIASTGLDISGQMQRGAGLSGSGVITSAGDAGTLNLTLASTVNAFHGSINETDGNPITLLVQGAGTQSLSGVSSYTGGTYLQGGTIVALNTAALGVGIVHMVDPTLQFGVSGTYLNSIALDVASINSGSAQTIGNDPATIIVADGVTATLAGTIETGSGTNAMGYAIDPNQSLVLSGLGAGSSLILTGDNTYSGGTILEGSITLDLAAPIVKTYNGIASGAAGTGSITFTSGHQNLKIEAVAVGSDMGHNFANPIYGFAPDDIIKLVGIGTATNLNYDNVSHALTVAGGNQIETLTINKAPLGYDYHVASDGMGGTELTLTAWPGLALFGTVTTDPHSAGGEVYALYEGLLGRAPDTLGLEYWADQFDHGASPATLAAGFLASAEGQARLGASDDAGFVNQLYQNTLGRSADVGGLSYWTDQLSHGATRVDVADSFVFSSEFTASVQQSLADGLFVPDAQAGDVARLYYTMLDRAPDAGGLQYWTSQLDHGGSLSSLAQGFLSTPENQAKYGSLASSAYVDALYENALGRHADAGGLDYWTHRLDSGVSRADLAVQLSDSLESHNVHLAQIEVGWHLS